MIEIVLSSALITILAGFTIPMGLRFFEEQSLSDTADSFQLTLRTAQMKAQLGYHGSNHGVELFPDQYVLFEGDSYAGRNEDFDISTPIDGVTFEGPEEIVFSALTGRPVAPSVYSLSSSVNNQVVIDVRDNGLTQRE